MKKGYILILLNVLIFTFAAQAQRVEPSYNSKFFTSSYSKSEGDGYVDHRFNFRVEKLLVGRSRKELVSASVTFEDWSKENFLMMPAAAYDGNRFEILNVGYPPIWPRADWRLDIPTTVTNIRHLSKSESRSSLSFKSGDFSTPAVVLFFPEKKLGKIFYFKQHAGFGNLLVDFYEDLEARSGRLVLSSYFYGSRGDSLCLELREYEFSASSILEVYERFFNTRGVILNRRADSHVTTYSAAWEIQEKLQNSLRWIDSPGENYYRSGNGDSPYGHLQIAWIGGLIRLYPMILRGDEISVQRSIQTINVVFEKMQGESGYLYGIYKNGRLYGDDFDFEIKADSAMVRKNGDALYWMVRNFSAMKERGFEIPQLWIDGTRRLADAFCNTWDESGQLGFHINPETGEINLGGSTSGATVPGALVYAYKYYNDPRYLEVAKEIAVYYYENFLVKGYTTGGPGEILYAPDSESSFALLDSYVLLYEATKDEDFLEMARDATHYFSSWVVSYDFEFPKRSMFARNNVNSVGAVWASVQNQHGAPGICTNSGLSIFKLYRATGNLKYLEMIQQTAHNILGYMSTRKRPIGTNKDGHVCERANLSDWEGFQNVGNVGPYANGWVESAIMLTVTDLPGIYIQPDSGLVKVFDHLDVVKIEDSEEKIIFKISNPTPYDARTKIYSESSANLANPLPSDLFTVMEEVFVPSHSHVIYEVLK
ncbi:MAG: hypothetical protein JXR63_08415 [Spirochaetales bacterium]|nr:hypothetical protein [Spirochaetales bacterium]